MQSYDEVMNSILPYGVEYKIIYSDIRSRPANMGAVIDLDTATCLYTV